MSTKYAHDLNHPDQHILDALVALGLHAPQPRAHKTQKAATVQPKDSTLGPQDASREQNMNMEGFTKLVMRLSAVQPTMTIISASPRLTMTHSPSCLG